MNIRLEDQEKEAQKKENIFNAIDSGWNFNTRPVNATSQKLITEWPEWRVFLRELSQKPKSSIGAFKQKAKTLSGKASELYNHIPIAYDRPEIRSRITAIVTKVNSLNLYIHLDNIPEKKVLQCIADVNQELTALQMQIDEIVRKSQIHLEQGEAEMIKMLDTSRAVPSNRQNKLIPTN